MSPQWVYNVQKKKLVRYGEGGPDDMTLNMRLILVYDGLKHFPCKDIRTMREQGARLTFKQLLWTMRSVMSKKNTKQFAELVQCLRREEMHHLPEWLVRILASPHSPETIKDVFPEVPVPE